MPGIRVHHDVHRNGMYVVETQRQYPVPYDCPICFRTHIFKANHINLDADGYGIVSTGVWEELQTVDGAGLTVANEVASPPPLQVGGPEGNPPVVGAFILEGG